MTEIMLNSHENLTTNSEGLFQRKRCNTVPGSLSDLLKNSSLRSEGNDDDERLDTSFSGVGGYPQSDRSMVEVATELRLHEGEVVGEDTIEEKVTAYNRKMSLDAFQIKLADEFADSLDVYEGALRFYVNDDNRKLCKAIHMHSTDTVTSLLPVIREKFSFLDITSTNEIQVVLIAGGEEAVLDGSARPLDIAIKNTSNQQARFVVKVHPLNHHNTNQNQNNQDPVRISTRHRSSRSRTPKKKNKPENGSLPNLSQGQPDRASMMDRRKDNKESSPAAALIESQRRKKRESSVEGKSSLGRRSGSLRSSRSKSMSSIFQKTFSFRKKENPYYHPHRTELSTEDTAPGVLRIFGDAISPGTQYKSVLASSNSTAESLVKDALERYSIPLSYARHFVLCDVIGKFVPYDNDNDRHYVNVDIDGIWQEECIRIIGDNERPLILQSFWKPSEGYSRRFELRNRGEFVAIENFEYNPFCESTPIPKHKSGSKRRKRDRKAKSCNLQEVQVIASHSSGDNISSGDNASHANVDIQENSKTSVHEEKVEYVNEQSITQPRSATQEYINDHMISPRSRQDSLGASISGEDNVSRLGMSNDVPLIMNLKGIDPQNDNLVHFLSKESTVIGCDLMKLGQSDICLPADDILSLHCRLLKDKNGKCSIEPCQGALVKINNRPILQRTPVSPGDILCLGKHYIFMFRDSKLESRTSEPASSSFAFVKLLQSGNFENEATGAFYYNQDTLDKNGVGSSTDNQAPPTSKVTANEIAPQDVNKLTSSTSVVPEPVKVRDWRKDKCLKYDQDQNRLKLSYSIDKEDEVITFILHTLDAYQGVYRLTPAYLMCMCLEFSAVKFDQLTTRQLLLKLASRVQTTILDKTKSLADRHGETSNPSTSIDDLLPDLQPVITWLANSLELLHFLNTHIGEYVLDPVMSLPAETRHSIAVAEDEVVAVLEDVVMYTFQQTVYYITKTLYSALTAVLDTNPFNDDDSASQGVTMESLLSIYQTTLNFLLDCSVHPMILSQLFSYLFFFTNTSLLNTLMATDSSSVYYQWSMGVRLRGNLDILEQWAQENHLHDEAVNHLQRLNCLVDLLATPKLQLKQADWYSLRRDFPSLSPAQLHNVLSHYNISPRPQHWTPGHEDRRAADTNDDLTVSFNSHPPLVLPGQGFLLDLQRQMEDVNFYHIVSELEALFGSHSDDVNLYNSQHQSRGFNQSKPQYCPSPRQPPSNHVQSHDDNHSNRVSELQSSSDVTDNIPWYKESPPDNNNRLNGTQWSSVDNSYNDSGFATFRSQEIVRNSKESLHESSGRHLNRSCEQNINSAHLGHPEKRAYSGNHSNNVYKSGVGLGSKSQSERTNSIDSPRNSSKQYIDSPRNRSHTNSPRHSNRQHVDSPRNRNYQNIVVNDLNRTGAPSFRSSGRENRSHDPYTNNRTKDSESNLSRAYEQPANSGANHYRNSSINDNHYRNSPNRSSLRSNYISNEKSGPVRDIHSHTEKSSSVRDIHSHTEKSGLVRDVNSHTVIKEQNISNSFNNLNSNNFSSRINHQDTSQSHLSNDNPLYMNMGQFNSSGQFYGNSVRHVTATSSSNTLTHAPLAFSTPNSSSGSSVTSGGQGDKLTTVNSSNSSRGDKSIPPPPILDRSSKPKPLNRVPPLDLHKLQDRQDYVHVDKASSLSPRATQNGLRVLPLTTDDHEGSSPLATRANDGQMVRESDMDEILYRDTMSRATDQGEDVFVMEIDKTERGLGLGLIDGLYTPLRQPGIYVRTMIPGAPADMDGRIRLGDRILAVNGNSIVGADYQSAMSLIKEGGRKVKFRVAKSDTNTSMQITASTC